MHVAKTISETLVNTTFLWKLDMYVLSSLVHVRYFWIYTMIVKGQIP